jgi:hypothetical protein
LGKPNNKLIQGWKKFLLQFCHLLVHLCGSWREKCFRGKLCEAYTGISAKGAPNFRVYASHFELKYARLSSVRLQVKRDGTWWRTGWKVKGNLANGVGSQYPSHYLGILCIQHYYRWCAQLGCQLSNELTPPPN